MGVTLTAIKLLAMPGGSKYTSAYGWSTNPKAVWTAAKAKAASCLDEDNPKDSVGASVLEVLAHRQRLTAGGRILLRRENPKKKPELSPRLPGAARKWTRPLLGKRSAARASRGTRLVHTYGLFMTFLAPASGDFDRSQFKLQADGAFKISIRGMAAMGGVDGTGLARSLKSAVDENPLPCARSLLAQGFNPVDVSTWGETGGIPETAVPFILEHYGINATSPSAQARAVLLALTRVGVNAYLKDKLGVSQVRDTQVPQLTPEQQGLEWLMGWGQRWGSSTTNAISCR